MRGCNKAMVKKSTALIATQGSVLMKKFKKAASLKLQAASLTLL
tara:strand:+ start:41 stop:172 length:132 start_codon:yes stop_codon:yes gene_type:complete